MKTINKYLTYCTTAQICRAKLLGAKLCYILNIEVKPTTQEMICWLEHEKGYAISVQPVSTIWFDEPIVVHEYYIRKLIDGEWSDYGSATWGSKKDAELAAIDYVLDELEKEQ